MKESWLACPMSKSAKLVFFGNERLATGVSTDCPVLHSLIKDGYEISAIVSSYSMGQSRSARGLEIEKVAKAHAIPLLLPEKLSEILDRITAYGAEAGVLVAYGKIIPAPIIDIFPKGIINIHPSLLPRYRGPTPIETAILDGASDTGVSLMKLASKMDAGPIYVQQKIKLNGGETKQILTDKLLNLGLKLLSAELPQILDEAKNPMPQNDRLATYTKLIQKADGALDFKKSAEQLEREVRAYAGWPKSQAKIFDHDVIVTKARAAKDESGDDLFIKCQPGYLEIQELVAPSGHIISGADFIRGYKK